MSRIQRELERSRADLLDLGLRNTLLNFRKLKSKGIEVVDEVPNEVFRLLVGEERTMTFLPAPEELVDEDAKRVRGDLLVEWLEANRTPDEANGDSPAERHRDTKLQTPYSAPRLERLLLNTYYTARSTIEEQGVTTLYLALGMLRWFESAASDEPRAAPLILLSVSLDRSSARSRFRIRYTGEDLGDNLSLQTKLRREFRIDIPNLPPAEDLEPSSFFAQVAQAIDGQERWQVDDKAVQLGFFWFTKLLMYEDLNPSGWSGEHSVDGHPVMGALLADGFADQPSPFAKDAFLDEIIGPSDLHQIRDADSSQTVAILDVQAGRNLVIQGPPGTGKSQTISNLIAESVAQGRRVLFVAEKMAALDVVKRRLDEDGIGDACVELHSHKTNKRSLLEELQRTLRLGKPDFRGIEDLETLTAYRDRLNDYAAAVNTPIGEASISPYRAYGEVLSASDKLGSDRPPPLEDTTGWISWTAGEFHERCRALRDLETLIDTTGVLADHPFWSSCRTNLMPRDTERLVQTLQTLEEELDRARASLRDLASLIHLRPPITFRHAKRLLAAAEKRSRMPPIDGIEVGDPAWKGEAERISGLFEQGRDYQQLHREFDPKLLPEAWERDVLALRTALIQFGQRWWRVLAPEYRRAIRELRELSRVELPKALEERLDLVEAVRRSQHLEKLFEGTAELLRRLFGAHWRSGQSDWSHLKAVYDWLREAHADLHAGRLPSDFLTCATATPDIEELHRVSNGAARDLARVEKLLSDLEESLELRRGVEWLREPDEFCASFEDVGQRIVQWRSDIASLHDIVRYNNLEAELRELGLQELSDLATRWTSAAEHLVDLLTYQWHNVLIEHALEERRELTLFEGRSHTEAIQEFQDLDRQCIAANRARVALAHWEQLPAANGGGQLASLRHEMEKKRRHLPIRRLMELTGEAIQRLKPVFMMSPLSIATYIPPGSVGFDLVIFDEASQIRPVEAFGAILRGRQTVVVGDSKQLPPTPFFEKLLDDGDKEEEERSVTEDLESILGLFVAKGAPERRLRWHYRSRHESLIAVSNHEFYENDLLIFPSPDHAREYVGVVLQHHPHTIYEPGTKRYNLLEAEIVADAVMEHARRRPDLSLGVAAFSQAQAQALQDQVELRRRTNPEAEAFFSAHPDEPFFAKNLENVQGDERDIVFISVGYGKQESGVLWMNFGPLNRDGGERRLNVLTTRARLRCEIFSNFRADEIDLSKTSSRGVVVLKRYLQFAEDGRLDLPLPSERPPDSVFEELVAQRVRELGYDVHPQVGSGGFFIDLAVVDPRRPGRYLLGIECDGRSYHSASWARDRDRLRQQILEGLGWSLHRVWSTDWFRNPDRELRKISQSLNMAGASQPPIGTSSGGSSSPVEEPKEEPFSRRDTDGSARHLSSQPYGCADVSDLKDGLDGRDLQDCPASWIATWVSAAVKVESPVHESDVVRRIVDAAGYQRTGSRLQSVVMKAITYATQRGEVERKGDFLWSPQRTDASVRDRSDLPPASRKMALISPEEIEAAIVGAVEAAVGIDVEEAVVEVVRLFGFARTTESMRDPVVRSISRLIERGRIEKSAGQLRVAGT